MFLKALGERIRQLRKNKNLTQADVAADLEIPISQIGRMERGESNFSVSYLKSLANVFEVKPHEILQLKSDSAE